MAPPTTVNGYLHVLPPPASKSTNLRPRRMAPCHASSHTGLDSKDGRWGRRCAAMAASVVITTAAMGCFGSGETLAATRWSERRVCPPWNRNSIESVVPEKLPRPLGRRATEVVAEETAERTAPAVGSTGPFLKYHSDCFSM